MVFSNVEKAGAFPEQHDLKLDESELVALDVPGMRSMISVDSVLMALSSRNDPAVALFDYRTLESRGKYLRHGNGPAELLPFTGPSRSNSLLRYSGDSLYMDVLGVNKDVLRWNVSAAFSDGREEIEAVPAFKDLKGVPFKWMLNDSTVLCKKLEDNSRRQVRELYVSGKLQRCQMRRSLMPPALRHRMTAFCSTCCLPCLRTIRNGTLLRRRLFS